MAKKYGKIVLDCDEAYTSQTGWDGKLHKVGGKKTITIDGISVDRDFNGARNILIKSLATLGAHFMPESTKGFVQ